MSANACSAFSNRFPYLIDCPEIVLPDASSISILIVPPNSMNGVLGSVIACHELAGAHGRLFTIEEARTAAQAHNAAFEQKAVAQVECEETERRLRSIASITKRPPAAGKGWPVRYVVVSGNKCLLK